MSVPKIIKFYRFEPQPSILNDGLTNKTSIELLMNVFPDEKAYRFEFDGDKYTIDILEIGTSFIFGTCAKENDFEYTSFYQLRDTQTNETEPYQSAMLNKQLEVYTYFYIDCSKNKMAAIMQKNISKIHEIFSSFIYLTSGNMLSFFVAPEKIKDIKAAAKNLHKIKKLELSFAPGHSKDDIKPLTQSLGDIEFESYTVNFKLAPTNNDSLVEKINDIFQSKRDDFSGMKFIGKNEFGLEETINFVETVYTQNTPFDLTEDYALNTEYIKQKLSQSIK